MQQRTIRARRADAKVMTAFAEIKVRLEDMMAFMAETVRRRMLRPSVADVAVGAAVQHALERLSNIMADWPKDESRLLTEGKLT